jgi:hypothetical protein
MAVDSTGRVWVAFSQRFNGPTTGTYGSRIMVTTLPKGSTTWTAPYVADNTAPTASTYAHQFMPSLNFAYGKMMLAWFDSRRDNLQSVLQCANPPCSDLSQVTIVDQPIPGSTLSNPATVFTPLISDPNSGVRHTIDVYGGVINPAGGPATFKAFQISQYPYYVDDANSHIEQGFFNPPNLPMFVQGTTPFIGDYIDISAQTIMPSGNSWAFNTQATDATGATNAPDFHIAWTDNRDVVPPPVVSGSQDWTQYVPPNGGNSQTSTYSGTGLACPTCSTVQPACNLVNITNADGTIVGTSSYSGDRNQNVYTSRISNGLIVRFRENAKVQPANTAAPPQRSYSLLVKNTVNPLSATPLGSANYYRVILGETSTSQGVTGACNTAMVPASFPGSPNCYLDVAVNPKTTLTEAINVPSSGANTSINVLVAQIACIPGSNGCGNTPSFVGLQALAVLNGDATNPSLAEADFLNTDNDDPDVEAPYENLPIAAGEEYNPTVDGPPDPTNNIFTPKISEPAIFTPKIGTVANNAPAIQTPTIFTPKITSIFTPKINSIQVANPTIVDTVFTPKIFTPKIFTPKIVSPDIFTPKINNLSDNSLTDYSWKVNNKGNTSASYNTGELVKSTGVQCCPASCSANPNSCTVTPENPAGPNCSVCQLIQHKVYESPVVNRDSTNVNPTCDLTVQQAYITVANVPDPAFTTGAASGSPSSPTNSTLSLSPGEGNRVTLRVVAPPVSQQVSPFKTQATPFTPNTGQNTAAGSLTITTSALPVAVVGQNYTNTAFASVGGFGATAWTIPADPTNPVAVIPPPAPNSTEPLPVTPLTLNVSGQISTSVVTAPPGSYTVNVQVQDSAITGATPTPALDVQQVALEVNQFTISSVDAQIVNEVGSTGYIKAGDVANVAVTVNSNGPANATNVIAGLTVNANAAGTPSGPMPVVTCSLPIPANASITGTGAQIFNFTCTAMSGNGYVTFTAGATGHYVNAAADVLATATSVTVPPSALFSQVIVDTVPPNLTYGGTITPTSAPGWYNQPVVVPYSTTDNLSGVASAVPASPATATGINASGNGSMTLTTEGKPVTGVMTVTDYAKNAAPFTSAGFNIDETPPKISGSPDRPANNFNWYNASVKVTFSCADPNPNNGPAGQQSGLATCTAPVTLSSEGANQNVLGTAVDNAANSTQTNVGPINIDVTKPTATAFIASPTVPASGWYNLTTPNVSFSYTPGDALSGVASSTPVPIAVTGEGTAVTAPVTVTDKAGNVLNTTTPPIKVDRTPPTALITSPVTNGLYLNGQPINAVYTCADLPAGIASGLATCIGSSPVGTFTTTTPGTYNFAVTATDIAGNQTVAAVPYSTTYYTFGGFQSPLAPAAGPSPVSSPPTSPTNSGIFVAGTTIPILWTLVNPVTSLAVTDPTTLTNLSAYPYNNATCTGGVPTGNTPIQLSPAQLPNSYGYDSGNARFQFLWNTGSAAAGCYYVLITFNDLSAYATNVIITPAGSSNALLVAGGSAVDGSNPNLPQSNTPVTMEAWINPSNANGTIFTSAQGYGLAYVNQHTYMMGLANDVSGSISILPGIWTHLAVSFDGTTATLYVNGSLDTGTLLPGTGATFYTPNSNAWRIGDIVGATPPAQAFVGSLDEIKVWNGTRNAGQIVSDMTNELCVGQSGLVAYYKFNQGPLGLVTPGATLFDVSSSQANGTINNYSNLVTSATWYQGNAPVTADQLSIALSPLNPSLSLSGTNTVQFSATGSCTDGSTPALNQLVWATGNGAIATISNSGLATATGTGNTQVTAAMADATGSTTVTIGP